MSKNINLLMQDIVFLMKRFTENSFYCDDAFFIDGDPRHKIGIRIELYSYEDIYQLASDRNSVFFKLLRREFDLECDQI